MSNWRTSEIQFLIDNGAKLPDADIGMMLGRSEAAVNAKRLQLGIFKEYAKGHVPMTDAEAAFLMQNHKRMTVNQMAAETGRTKNTIEGWLKRNHMKAKTRFKHYNVIDKETGKVVGRRVRNHEAARIMGVQVGSVSYIIRAKNHRRWRMEEVE